MAQKMWGHSHLDRLTTHPFDSRDNVRGLQEIYLNKYSLPHSLI